MPRRSKLDRLRDDFGTLARALPYMRNDDFKKQTLADIDTLLDIALDLMEKRQRRATAE